MSGTRARRGTGRVVFATLLAAALAGCTGSADQERGESAHGAGVPDAALPSSTGGGPAAVLGRGLAHSIEEAARGLAEGRRARAMRAVDEAARIGEVAEYAASGAAQEAIARAVGAVHQARRDVQTGRPEEAQRRLAEISRWLRQQVSGFPAEAGPASGHRLPPWFLVEDDERYYGATLLNARGAPLGEVVGFVRSGDRIERVIVAAGWRDFLGFWDVSGHEVAVPGSALVFGPENAVGTTHIALLSSVGPETFSPR